MSSMAKLACTVWAIAALLAIHPHDVIAQCTLYTPNLSIGITDEVQFQTSWVDCVVSFPVCSCQMTQVLTFLFRTHASHWNQTPVVIQQASGSSAKHGFERGMLRPESFDRNRRGN